MFANGLSLERFTVGREGIHGQPKHQMLDHQFVGGASIHKHVVECAVHQSHVLFRAAVILLRILEFTDHHSGNS